ncbi:MAG TPA: HU family DNA-binding protein [Friedmanniella sp.]
MNKAELIKELSPHFDGSKIEAARALRAVVDTITSTVSTGEKVSVTGFGVFEKVDRPARTVRNPRTGERKAAEASSIVRFRPGTDLKASVSPAS